MNRVLFVFTCFGIARHIAAADTQVLLAAANMRNISVSVLIMDEDKYLRNKIHHDDNMPITTTVAGLVASLRDTYLIGNLKIGVRRYEGNFVAGMYYYSGTFKSKRTLISIIKEFKTNEFFATPDYTAPKKARARFNNRSNSGSLALSHD